MHSKYIWSHSIYPFNMGRWYGWGYLRFPYRPHLLLCGNYDLYDQTLFFRYVRCFSALRAVSILSFKRIKSRLSLMSI